VVCNDIRLNLERSAKKGHFERHATKQHSLIPLLVLVKSYITIDIPFDQFIRISEIKHIHDLSIYWSLDGVFHETNSASLVQKEDILRFLDENRCEIISVRFICNGMFEIESDGKSETVISVHETSIVDVQERNTDALERNDLMSNLEETERMRNEHVLLTRKVE
jgi:hypothetical protein